MKTVKAIVEVRGGIVQAVYSDGDLDVAVLDYDNMEASEESNSPGAAEEFARYSELEEKVKSMREVY